MQDSSHSDIGSRCCMASAQYSYMYIHTHTYLSLSMITNKYHYLRNVRRILLLLHQAPAASLSAAVAEESCARAEDLGRGCKCSEYVYRNMCICICIYTHMYIHTHIHIHIYEYPCIYLFIHEHNT